MKTKEELEEAIRDLKKDFKDGAFTWRIDDEEYSIAIVDMIRVLKWVLNKNPYPIPEKKEVE